MSEFSLDYLKYRLEIWLNMNGEEYVDAVIVNNLIEEIDRYGYKLVKKEESVKISDCVEVTVNFEHIPLDTALDSALISNIKKRISNDGLF
jgi:hypothetical protein